MQKIVIEVSGKADLKSTIDQLIKLGAIDEKNAENFSKNSKKNQDSLDKTTSKLTGLGKVATNLGPALAGLFAANQVISFGKAIIDTTAQFQKFEAVLTNSLGSKSEAQKALRMISEFASKTPFSVAELTESFVKLTNQGFKPTQAELRKLGDLAASTGKSFDQLAEAIIDAQTGEFERLKEFGIRARKEGDKVTFTFKGVEKQVKFTNESIRDYIVGLGDLKGVSGSMAAISQTLGGQISNLGDSFDRLLVTLGKSGDSGISAGIGFLNSALDELTKALEDKPSLFDSVKEAILGVYRPVRDLFEGIGFLIERFTGGVESGTALKFVFDGIGKTLKATLIPLKLFIQGWVTAIDVFELFTKAGENAFKFLKGEKVEPIDLSKLKKDFTAFADIVTMTDGKFQHATDTIVEGSEEIKKSTEKQIVTLESLKNKLSELQKTRDQTAVTDTKTIAALNAEIKATDELIKKLEGRDEATKEAIKNQKAWEEMRKRTSENAANLDKVDIKRKTDLEEESEKERLKKLRERLAEKHKQNKAYYDAQIKLSSDSNKQISEDEAKRIEDSKEARQQAVNAAIVGFTDISNAAFENARIREQNEVEKANKADEEEIARLERRRKAGRISEETLQAQKEVIQKRAEQRDKELRKRQAEAEKKQALFNIAINTAQAVLKAIAQFGPPPSPAGIIGIAAALAAGGIQAGIVASRPLPAFKKGVVDFNGEGTGTSDSNIVRISKGESVITAKATNKYKDVLEAMNKGYDLPIINKKSLTDARNEGMGDKIYKSLLLHGGFNDKNIVDAIRGSAREDKADKILADRIVKGISDRASENKLFS